MMNPDATRLGVAIAPLLAGQDQDVVVHALASHCIAAFMQAHGLHPQQAKTLLCQWLNDQPFQDFIPDARAAHEPI